MRYLITPIVATLLLSGCVSGGSEQAVSKSEMTSEEELQIWASETCTAMSDLKMTVIGFTDSIDIDLSAGLDQLPQVYADLEANVAQVEARIDDVQGALGRAPESSPQAVAFATEAQQLITSARVAGDQALVAGKQAVDATNFLEAGVAAASALAAARSAYDDANAALALVDEVTSGGQGALSAAFTAAPECRSV